MNNADIAGIFQDIADLLEMEGKESPFKVRAYQRAARTIEGLPVELSQVAEEKRLREIPGIGEAIAKKITELLATGRLEYYEKLRSEFPPSLTTLLEIPGVGPRTAMRLYKELGISSVEELEQAIQTGQVAALFRMGEKTADNILRHIQALRRKDQRIPIGEALPVVEGIIGELKELPGLHRMLPAGSLRRFRETIGDVDIMGTADDPESVIRAFTGLPQVGEVLGWGKTKASVVVEGGLQADLRMVEPDCFGSLLQYFTGSKGHNIALRERAVRGGLKLSEYGITPAATGITEKFDSEEAFYERLGLQYIPPEIREAQGEIEAAERGTLPTLVATEDIKGDLHLHTDWSDGHASIEGMALAARDRGYRYIAITDHSAGRGIARGLSEERLRRQIEEIRGLDARLEGIRIFAGAEVDIRADGSLDLSEELLAQLDVVVAAVHSAMSQDEGKMTRRVVGALESPYVSILAHPTCRLLGWREPVSLDMEAVFEAAVRTGTALEINAMPDRLDLRDAHISRARELGVVLAINTDSHSPWQLELVRFGVGVARRGWCGVEHILNTRPLAEVEGFLRRKRSGR